MPNPWRDPEKARTWIPHDKPGNVQRPEQFDVVLTLVAAHAPKRMLDLGCGMGDFDAALLARHPEAQLVCLDESPVMLERTREALGAAVDRASFVESALEDAWSEETGGGFDVVTANQCVHHIEAEAKRALFAQVHGVLRPGGLFLLNDKLAFAGALWPQIVGLWDRVRVPAGFAAVEPGATHAGYLAKELAGSDVPDAYADQLGWLRAAGLDPVDCFWRYADKAIFGGLRP